MKHSIWFCAGPVAPFELVCAAADYGPSMTSDKFALRVAPMVCARFCCSRASVAASSSLLHPWCAHVLSVSTRDLALSASFRIDCNLA
jgi:hypothetical protein